MILKPDVFTFSYFSTYGRDIAGDSMYAGYSRTSTSFFACRTIMRFAPVVIPVEESVVYCGLNLFTYEENCTDNVHLKLWKSNLNPHTVTLASSNSEMSAHPDYLVANPVYVQHRGETRLFKKYTWNEVSTLADNVLDKTIPVPRNWIPSSWTWILAERTPRALVNFHSPTALGVRPYMYLQYTTPPTGLNAQQIGFNKVGVSWNLLEDPDTAGRPEPNLARYDVWRTKYAPDEFGTVPEWDESFIKVGSSDPNVIIGDPYYGYVRNHFNDGSAKYDARTYAPAGGTRYWYKVRGVWINPETGQEIYSSLSSEYAYVVVMEIKPIVQRFLIRDLDPTGFPDYVFTVNPTDYTPNKSDTSMFQYTTALCGRVGCVKFPLAPESRTLKWNRIERPMFRELKNRFDSGHTFYILDHNSEEFVGIIDEFDFKEIVATVPSKYEGSFKMVGTAKKLKSVFQY